MTNFVPRRCGLLLAFPVLVTLSACGGGGSDTDSGGNGNQGRLTLSSLNIAAGATVTGASPTTQQLNATISPAQSGTVYIRIVVAGQVQVFVSNIAVTSSTTGRADIDFPSPASLGPGNFTGTIQVTACTSGPDCTSGVIGSTQTVSVSYTVNGVTVSEPSLDYTITDNSVNADYRRQLAITAHPSYSVAVDAAWLSVTPDSGSAGNSSVEVNLDRNVIDDAESGLHAANVTVSVSGANSVTVPVNAIVAKPQFDQVTPYVGFTGVGDTVTIRGQYLDSLASTQIDFAPDITSVGIPANSVQLVSPTELTVSHPGLAADRYIVRMYDSAGAVRDRSLAQLVVIDAPGFVADVLPYPDSTPMILRTMIFDPERRALLVGANFSGLSVENDVLLRYSYDAGWNGPEVINVPYISTQALSANGKDLLVSSMTRPNPGDSLQGQLAVFSPDATAIRQSYYSGITNSTFTSIAFTSDNKALLMEGSPSSSGLRNAFIYDMKTNANRDFRGRNTLFLDDSIISVSGDGQRAVFASDSEVGDYDVPGETFVRLAQGSGLTKLDRHGDLLVNRRRDSGSAQVFHFEVFDRSWTLLGEVQSALPWFVLSPDGTRLYTYTGDNVLHSFDLTAAPVAGQYPEIGTGTTLAADPGYINGGFAYPVEMAISADGSTVFVGSSRNIVVQPVN